MLLPTLLLLFLSTSLTLANPAPKPPTGCKKVNIECNTAANAYCNSYLGLPQTTTITNVKTRVVKTEGITSATTATSTITTPTATTTDATVYVTGCTANFANKNKRTVDAPSCFASYSQPAQISSACSCLKLPQTTTVRTQEVTKVTTTVPVVTTTTTYDTVGGVALHTTVTSAIPADPASSGVVGSDGKVFAAYQLYEKDCSTIYNSPDATLIRNIATFDEALQKCADTAVQGKANIFEVARNANDPTRWNCVNYKAGTGENPTTIYEDNGADYFLESWLYRTDTDF